MKRLLEYVTVPALVSLGVGAVLGLCLNKYINPRCTGENAQVVYVVDSKASENLCPIALSLKEAKAAQDQRDWLNPISPVALSQMTEHPMPLVTVLNKEPCK